MATASAPTTTRTPTVADILIDGLTPSRILLHPTPGTATGADVVAIRDREGRLCELIVGTLVEKTMGSRESNLAARLIYLILSFTEPRNLAELLAPDGMIRFGPDQIRLPDIAVFLRERLPDGKLPDDAILSIVPDLAVEILSEGNSRQEMDEKRALYFAAGVRLVWYADPRRRQVWVYDGVDRGACLDHTATLEGGAVLPASRSESATG